MSSLAASSMSYQNLRNSSLIKDAVSKNLQTTAIYNKSVYDKKYHTKTLKIILITSFCYILGWKEGS